MNRHQVLTGALNPGDSCFAVGYVEGIPFTAYASGCDLVILASNFQRVQIIPGDNHGNIQVGCIDCSSENGKIAASYANQVYIFEPKPISVQKKSAHKLDYQWQQTGSFKIESLTSNLSWNHDGSRLLTGSDSIQLWACGVADSPQTDQPAPSTEASSSEFSTQLSSPTHCWECVWQCKTATPVYHLKFSPDGQFFASAGKADRLVKIWYATRRPVFHVGTPGEKQEETTESKGEHYSFVYIAHPRAVTGFSWRRTSKYMPRGSVANVMVTSCRDNICRLWSETVLPDNGMIDTSTQHASTADKKREINRQRSKPHFSVGNKNSKKKKSDKSSGKPLSDKSSHQHSSMQGVTEVHQTNGHKALPLHFHIAATINPNTDIPLLPAIGSMSKGNAPNFVVNWLNNKELQYTLAAETLLQTGKPGGSETDDMEEYSISDDSDSDRTGEDCQDSSETSQSQTQFQEEEATVPVTATASGRLTPPEILTIEGHEPNDNKPLKRPTTLGSIPSVEKITSFTRMTNTPMQRLQKKFDNLMREWHQNPDMLYSIHPIDGSFLLWLVDWIDEHIPGVHRQPQVSFSCRIPHAFPIYDATTLCTNLVLYRSNLTIDPRAARRRQPETRTFKSQNRGMTPSFSFSQRLGQVPAGVNIYAFTPRVSMLSKHSNGTLNQWEISFSEKSKFQTVLNIAHVQRCCGHRFQVNDLRCHPVLPLLVTTSHHNIPKVEVDPEIVVGRNRRTSVAAKRTSVALGIGTANTPSPGQRRSSSINIFGKNLLSESEHSKLSALFTSAMEGTETVDKEKEEIVIPDAIMEKLQTEMNWPDMSAPTGLCSELILWRVFPVGPLSKSGGVVELARINSPFLSAFAHVSWLPGLLPSSCLGQMSNSPSACFVASDGYTLRLFQAVIDARSLLTEILPNAEQLEGYLSSSSPLTQFIHPEALEAAEEKSRPNIISLQSTSRPGCIIELDMLTNAKQNWQNVQLMHVFQQHFITGKKSQSPYSVNTEDPSARPPSGFGQKFFLVVMEHQQSGQSVLHMWYIQLQVQAVTSSAPREARDIDDIDIVPDSSPDTSDAGSPMHYEPPSNIPQVTTKLKTYSRKVCMQKLELPPGVEVLSATPAAGHLSSSTIYPACNAPYLISTACSDGKLRFWQCELAEGGINVCFMDEMEADMASSESGTYEDDEEQYVDKEYALASYKWDEWKLLIHEDSSSAVEVPGRPVALSCAYNGRIASMYRTDVNAPSRSKVPLKVIIIECESTGGSEWMIEDKLDLGVLDLDHIRNGAPGSMEAESVNYKIMKRSSKVEDFLDIQDAVTGLPSALDLANSNVRQQQASNNVISPTKRLRTLPVQLAWVSKEDGSHILTVGIGMKIIIFAPVLGNRAGAYTDGDTEVSAGETSLFVPPSVGSTLLAKEESKPKWTALCTINLSTVDGIPPHSKMLSWVRAGILVVGLENEMHVYSQWKHDDGRSVNKKLNNKQMGKEDTRKEDDNLSVNLLAVPMTKSDREQSVTDMTALVKEEDDLDDVGEPEDVTFDPGLFEMLYIACPVLPQYHPKQLMELMNCGRFRRVKAILAHLVRCIAGENAVRKAIGGDCNGEDDDADTSTAAMNRTLSLSTSPVEAQGIDEADVRLDYIELASIPPLPLYALLSADKESATPLPAETNVKRKPTITRAGTITQPPPEASHDYSGLFSSSVDHSGTSPTFDVFTDVIPREKLALDSHKLTDPCYFGVAQSRLLTSYLTHMHLPGLTSLDQMNLLALADTVASTKTEITTHSSGVTGTLVGRDGAGYAETSGTSVDTAHAGETLDECGLRYLLSMRFHMCLRRSMPPRQQIRLVRDGLATSNFAWAFHSESEEELLLLIPGMQKGQPTWGELRAMGIGWWVRNSATLKRCIEKVAKAQFQKDKNPLDAALFYLAMKKKTLLWGLFRSVHELKMTTFFGNDFTKDRWRKAALKNAFSLLGRQRFEHAAAFFLLAGSLKDAVEILVNKLQDLQLAMVVTRLYEDELEMSPFHKELLFYHIFACDPDGNRIEGKQPTGDPFLRSIAYWMIKDYTQALETLLKRPPDSEKLETENKKPKTLDVDRSGNPDVFNFYNYLRTHPLVLRRQMLNQDNISQGSTVLISQGGKDGKLAFKDEITPVERRLFFATAHAHQAAGCPLLTLEVLSKLPRVKTSNANTLKADVMKKTPNASSSVDSGMIMSGTIDGGLSNSANGTKETSNGFDWGQPISESKVTSKDSALDFDWSHPVGTKDEDELELKWSDDDDDDSEDESRKVRTNNEINHNGSTSFSDKTDSSENEQKIAPATLIEDGQPIDIIAQQVKFTACLKIMMEELRTLATGFEVDGGQLRFQLYVWLEHEVETLRAVCNYGTGKLPFDDIKEKSDEKEEQSEYVEGIKSPALHELIQARRIDLEEKRQRATRRKNWLRSHHHLLRTLFSYAVLYGFNGGGLCSVTMEIVLLVQELQQERLQQQLSSPLPLPTTLPLLSASIASCKTVVADPILHLRNFTQDILKSILDFTAPPSANRQVSRVNTLNRLSVALSACIYQTLCDSDSYSMGSGTSKFTGMDVYDGRNIMYRTGSLVGVNRRRRCHSSGENLATVTSLPSKWPGVSTLQALLASERDEDVPNPNIQLCEGLFATYISFLVHALSTSNCSELFRLVAHQLDGKMWSSVFGGGAKVVEKTHTQAGTSNTSSTEQHDASKQRNRYMLRLMGKASSGRPSASVAEEKPMHREVFVPPETSIMDYFMVKPYVDLDGVDYDSNNSDSSDEDLDEYYDDDMYEETGPFAAKRKSKIPLPGEAEHSDSNSYSWCLMRYAILKFVVYKIQAFLPLSGIELAELPVASPNLHSVLKLLEQWQHAIIRKLELFAGPPQDFIPGCSTEVPSTISGPALLRYKGLLDPINTPFRSTHKSAKPVKRLWNYLVRQDPVQDLFINYIFHRKPGLQGVDYGTAGGNTFTDGVKSQCRIIHKEQEKIPAFCFNQADWKNVSLHGEFRANPTGIIVSSQRGLLELDISMLLNPNHNMWVEEDVDDTTNSKTHGGTMIEDDFLLVNPRERTLSHPYPGITPTPSMITSGFNSGEFLADQTGRGTNIITRRPLYHIRRLASHPSLPYYLSGSNDGSVHMWEWGHSQKLYTHRGHGQFPKVTQIHFNDQGNKFGVCDDSGALSLWQVGMNTPAATKPYWSKTVHNKAVYDFSFLGSSSFLATAGFSTENKNVCLWDTLMHPKKCMVHAFSCHEGGCPSLTYCPRQQILISGNKKGEVSIYDVRQRKLRHSFQAHESGIKCLAVDPSEEFFATGSAEGNIKVWCLSVHSLLHFFPGQHSRGTFFRQSGSGVLQLAIMPSNHLYSCGADGTMKWRLLPEWDSIL